LAGGVLLTGPGSGLTGQSAGSDEIAELRGEVSSMRQLLTLSLLRQESASQRLRAMSWSRQLEAPEDEVMSALLTAVETDPNVNVRLAALDAVRRFADQAKVKRRLVEMLGEPSSPLVRIGLIDVLADLRDEESTSAIRRLVEEDELDPAVRQKALLVLDY
jgi:HEAT repeat protein